MHVVTLKITALIFKCQLKLLEIRRRDESSDDTNVKLVLSCGTGRIDVEVRNNNSVKFNLEGWKSLGGSMLGW